MTPDDYLVSKVTGEVVREQVSDKAVEYVPRADGHGTVRVDGRDRSAATCACLDDAALSELVAVARRVEHHFGSHQDIEWAIARRRRCSWSSRAR